MALDATVGGLTANSYVTVSEADGYFNHRFHAVDIWEDMEDKTSILITASLMLDWFAKWKGNKVNSEQARDWPRANVIRPDGSAVASTIIPDDVKVAVYELALSSITSDRVAENPLAGLSHVQAGPLTIKKGTGFDPTKKESIPEHVWKIISDIIVRSGIGVIRLERA